MNRHADHHPLLADVLTEAEPADFRRALLDVTLRDVRRRRRRQRAVRTAFAAAAAIAVTFWLWRMPEAAEAGGCPIVRTRPLAAPAIISTRSFNAVQRVASQPFLASFHTLEGMEPVRLITDAELLALAGPRPAVLVRVSPQEQTLIFADEPPRQR